MLLDAHTHLDGYDQPMIDVVLAEIDASQMVTVAVATDPESFIQTQKIAVGHSTILPCFGIHPWQAHRYSADISAFVPLIEASPMIGEIGLDYVWDDDPSHYPTQRAVFAAFLEQARQQDMAVNLHTKGAEHEVAAMLQRFAIRRAIVHWYSGPRDAFDMLVAHGCWFTFGVETALNPTLQELAQAVPLDRILTETDGPSGLHWLTGELGMPHHINGVLAELARLRGCSVADMGHTVAINWQELIANDKRFEPYHR